MKLKNGARDAWKETTNGRKREVLTARKETKKSLKKKKDDVEAPCHHFSDAAHFVLRLVQKK